MSHLDKLLSLSRQLYPTGRAFKMPFDGESEKLHKALLKGESKAYEDALGILNSILPDNDKFTVDDAALWERRLGLISDSAIDLESRKLAIRRKMNHPGTVPARQSALYLEGQLQAAGFDVYVYENNFLTPVPTGAELTNDPYFNLNEAWFDLSYNAIYFSSGYVQIATLPGRILRTDNILEIGKKYRVELTVDSIGPAGSALFVGGGVREITATGNQYFDFTAAELRVDLSTNLTSNLVISKFSVKETTDIYTTKGPLEITGGVGGADIQMGDFQHGDNQHGKIWPNMVVNHIDESLDASFGVGNNLRSTVFIGGNPIGSFAFVEEVRKKELRQLILRIKPVQVACFLLVNYY